MNLPEKLAREIHRVTLLRAQYAEAQRLGGDSVCVAPAMLMMDAALENAMKSAGLFDPLAQAKAVIDLEGFTR